MEIFSTFEPLKNFIQFNEIKRRFREDNKKTLNFDHEPTSNSITVTKKIFDPKYNQEMAMVGLQMSYSFLNDFWRNATIGITGWSECFEV